MWATTGGSGEHQRVSRHMCYALAATGRGVLVAAPHVGAAGGRWAHSRAGGPTVVLLGSDVGLLVFGVLLTAPVPMGLDLCL